MKKIIIQAFAFFGISGIGWIIDMTIYTILSYLNVNTIICNIISSFVAVSFVYITSTRKLFQNNNKSLNVKKKYLFYVIYQIFIVLLSSYVISIISNYLSICNIEFILIYHRIIAKIIITPFTMLTNFIFMKLLIEKI